MSNFQKIDKETFTFENYNGKEIKMKVARYDFEEYYGKSYLNGLLFLNNRTMNIIDSDLLLIEYRKFRLHGKNGKPSLRQEINTNNNFSNIENFQQFTEINNEKKETIIFEEINKKAIKNEIIEEDNPTILSKRFINQTTVDLSLRDINPRKFRKTIKQEEEDTIEEENPFEGAVNEIQRQVDLAENQFGI